MNRQEIDKIVAGHQKISPVPVISIAKDMRMRVFRVNGGWTDDISGSITKENDAYIIHVNASHPETRRRFTIAHEIAHFVLHRELIGNGIEDDAMYRSLLSNRREREANEYASELLMPWNLINIAIEGGANTIKDLATEFNVSKYAMSIRLGIPYE